MNKTEFHTIKYLNADS